MTTSLNDRRWQLTTLGSHFRIKHGFAFKGKFFSDSGPYVLLTPGNFREEGGLKLKGEKEKYYTSDFPLEFLLERGDLLVAMTDLKQDAPILGSAAFITENESFLHNQRLGKIIDLDEEKIDKHFLFYLFNTANVREQIKASATGSTVRHTAPDRIYSVKIELPPLPTQRKIASVLSAYDDLIENNARRIEILEEMAQRIYEEWFVHFRFPGYEKVKMVDSELGPIPEGWQVKPVGELLSYHIGGGWGKEEKSDEYPVTAYVIRGTDIPAASRIAINSCPLRFHKKSNLASRQLRAEDVVFEVSGGSKGQPVGRSLLVREHLLRAFDEDVMCASFCKLLRVDREIMLPQLLFLHFLRIYDNGQIEKYQVQSTGITNFKFKFFLESELVLVPDADLQTRFDEVTVPLFRAVGVLGAKNTTLRHTRNLLLPKLISGEVSVEDLDVPRESQ